MLQNGLEVNQSVHKKTRDISMLKNSFPLHTKTQTIISNGPINKRDTSRASYI